MLIDYRGTDPFSSRKQATTGSYAGESYIIVDFMLDPYRQYREDIVAELQDVVSYESDPEVVGVARKVLTAAKKGKQVALTPDENSTFLSLMTSVGFQTQIASYLSSISGLPPELFTKRGFEKVAKEHEEFSSYRPHYTPVVEDPGAPEPTRGTPEWEEWEIKRRAAAWGDPSGTSRAPMQDWPE